MLGKSIGLKHAKAEKGMLGRGDRASKDIGSGKQEEQAGNSRSFPLDSSDGYGKRCSGRSH